MPAAVAPPSARRRCLAPINAQFVQGVFIESYDPTIEDSYRKQIDVDGRQVMLEIMDTAGTEQFTSMREFYMRDAHGFLLVFSITSLSSLHELAELREQIVQIKGGDPNVPIVLVGNKSDLEEDRVVSRSRAFQVSQAWGGVPYYETSARRRQNVSEVFVDVCRQIMHRDLSGRARRGGGREGQGQGGGERAGGGDGKLSRRRRKGRRAAGYEEDERYDHRGRRSRCTIL
ncbi:Ras-related protein rsr1 [Friedmanniomyces endolithicus]|nr:Ras-related protein rsr1 [Friedmanniomyces endolithicus]